MVYSYLEILRDYFLTNILIFSLFSSQKHIISDTVLLVPCFCLKTAIYLRGSFIFLSTIIHFLLLLYDVGSLQETIEIIKFFIMFSYFCLTRFFFLFRSEINIIFISSCLKNDSGIVFFSIRKKLNEFSHIYVN